MHIKHRWPVNSPHKGLVTRKIFPFDDVIMNSPSVCALLPPIMYFHTLWHGVPISLSKEFPFRLTAFEIMDHPIISSWITYILISYEAVWKESHQPFNTRTRSFYWRKLVNTTDAKVFWVFDWQLWDWQNKTRESLIVSHRQGFYYMSHLTHLLLMSHICVGQHWFRSWFVACSAPSYYLITFPTAWRR